MSVEARMITMYLSSRFLGFCTSIGHLGGEAARDGQPVSWTQDAMVPNKVVNYQQGDNRLTHGCQDSIHGSPNRGIAVYA